jgi:hypothetical protein
VVLEHGEPGQVDRARHFGRERAGSDLDGGRNASARCREAQQCSDPARLEQRRVDGLRELGTLVERSLHVAFQIAKERRDCCRIGARRLDGELEVDREPDQVLLDALVQLAFDPAVVGIGCQDQTFPGSA